MAKLPYLSYETPKTWQEANRIAASKMAMQGFPVFPCYAFGTDKLGNPLVKKPVGRFGSWKQWRPRAAQEIADLWRGEWSEYLPAISLETHDLVVFDPDVRETSNGLDAWEKLCRENLLPPGVPLVNTAGGGLHAYFKQLPDLKLGNGEGDLPDNINVRGVGGYVIAPGAMLPDGRQWAYREGTVFRSAPVIPDWLFNMVHPSRVSEADAWAIWEGKKQAPSIGAGGSRYWDKAFTDEISALAAMPSGGRNNALNDAAFRIMRMVMLGAVDRTAAINALVDASHANGLVRDDGMPQVMQTIMSGFRGAENKPRPAPAIKLEMPRLDAPRCARTAKSEIDEEEPENREDDIRRTAAELQGVRFYGDAKPKPMPYIIKGMVPARETGTLLGQSGAGKSFVVADMAIAVATGTPFFGRKIKETVGVLILASEGGEGMHDRLTVAAQNRGFKQDSHIPVTYWPHRPNLFDNKDLENVRVILGKVDAIFREKYGVRLGLVFIETASKAFAMDDEGNRDSARAEAAAHYLVDATGATVVVSHHIGKDKERGARGGSGWRGNFDFSLLVDAERDARGNCKNHELVQEKLKDGQEGPISKFKLGYIQLGVDEDGEEFGTRFVTPETEPDWNAMPARELSKREAAVIGGLRNAIEGGLSFDHVVGGYDVVTVQAVTEKNLINGMIRFYGVGERRTLDNKARAALKGAKDSLVKSGMIGTEMHRTDDVYWLI